MPEERTICGSSYEVADGAVQVNVSLTVQQAARIDREVPEATNGPEAIRMLVEQALRRREQEVTPARIEEATGAAVSPIREDVEEIRAILCEMNRDVGPAAGD